EMNAEELKKVLGHGLFQKRIAYLLLLGALIGTAMLFGSVFVMFTPPHRCYLPEIDALFVEWKSFHNISFSFPEIKYKARNYRLRVIFAFTMFNIGPANNMPTNRTLVYCDHGWFFYKSNGVITAATEFELVCDRAWITPLFPSIQMIGFMFGSILGGIMSDRYGRRKVILFSMTLVSASMLLMGLAPTVLMLQIGVFSYGFSIITRAVTAMVILNELLSNDKRRTFGILVSVFCGLGGCVLSVVAYCIPNWRWMTLAIAITCTAHLPLYYCFIRDTFGWLIQNKRIKSAEKLYKEVVRVNNINVDEALLSDLKLGTKPDDDESNDVTKVEKFTYIDFVTVPFLRKRILLLSFMWFSMNMGFYGLSFNTPNLGGNRFVNAFISSVVEIPAQFLCFVLVKKIGCRMGFISTAGACSVCVLLTPFLQSTNQIAGVVCAMLGKFFISAPFTILYLVTGDLFPTMLRTQSYGACSFIGRVAAIIVPYVLYLGKTVHPYLPYIVIGTVTFISAIAALLLPETTGINLPDTLEDAKQ
uniref:Major facilitator superfamily (MFS) profile domain-containing protein n=1 Tax=Ciona intestinalis TaxID=7719 RepID=F6Y4W3_CIOIN